MTDPTNTAAASRPLTRDRLDEFVRAHDIKTIMLGVPHLMGRLKGKTFDASHFLTRMQSGAEMCAYILASDAHMTPLNGFRLTGWHDGYGDLTAVPDPTTIRRLSYLPHTALLLADAHHHNGTPIEVAPRQMLRRQIAHLADFGFQARVGIESEFLLYRGNPHRIHHNGYHNLVPVSPHNLDYALDHPPALTAFLHDLQHALHQADAPVEAIKTEGAPGQIEVTWPYGDPMRACDTGHLGQPVPAGARRRGACSEHQRTRPPARTGTREPGTPDEDRVPGKSGGLLRPGIPVTEKYEFIDGEAGNFPVQQMCTWAGVSTSGFYHWRSRPLSATAKRRAELRAVILQVFSDSHETYGYRRVHAALQRMNVQAGAELVRALMRELGLVPCQPRPWRATTTADDAAPATPDPGPTAMTFPARRACRRETSFLAAATSGGDVAPTSRCA
ncbi:IS3 family transposase [Streptomyces sp. NPDC005195]|uniref:IS3 family transposase n=1 Tax=Streptomyces sp. NPDC005195 TaxID=3154561 RepID=UPI0033A3247D